MRLPLPALSTGRDSAALPLGRRGRHRWRGTALPKLQHLGWMDTAYGADLIRAVLHVTRTRRRQQRRGNRHVDIAHRAVDRIAPALNDGGAEWPAIDLLQ